MGEEPKPRDRPRIGLVLSGGAALGCAHVGVLKVLEELRIPVDCVAGTSMGAIVGGLYASGMSIEEIEAMMLDMDWKSMQSDELPRRERSWRSKLDEAQVPTEHEIGFQKGRFLLPTGLIVGRKFSFTLKKALLPVIDIHDFSQLPIPFRAMATDLETGDAVVLAHGDLSRAIRASMSVPGVFSPVEIDGHLLVDGGLVANLPVHIARDMGADIVIAVDVGTPLSTRDKLQSLGKITSQVVSMVIRQNVEASHDQADILIRPDMTPFSGMQFERADEMILAGETATRSGAQALSALSVSPEVFASQRKRQTQPDWWPVISSIQLSESVHIDPRGLLEEISVETGKPLDLVELEKSLNRIYRLGYYETVDFQLAREGPEGYHLLILARQKSWGPNALKFGLELEADFRGDSSFNFKSIFTQRPLNRYEGEWKTTAFLGETPSLRTEWFQPLSFRRNWFVDTAVDSRRSRRVLITEQDRTAVADIWQWSASASLGYLFDQYGAVSFALHRTGGELEITSGEIMIDGQIVDQVDVDSGGFRLTASFDQLDHVSYPMEGWGANGILDLGRESLGAPQDFKALSITLSHAFRLTEKASLLGLITYQSALDTNLPPQNRFSLGGFFALSGLPIDAVSGQYGGNLSLAYIRKLRVFSSVAIKAFYAGITAETGYLWEDQDAMDWNDLIHANALVVGLDTWLGPVNLAYGVASTGESSFYFLMGRAFD